MAQEARTSFVEFLTAPSSLSGGKSPRGQVKVVDEGAEIERPDAEQSEAQASP